MIREIEGQSMRCSFLFSAFDRPHLLWGSLGSLIAQEIEDWECIVLCNGTNEMQSLHRKVIDAIGDPRIGMIDSRNPSNPAWDCYWSAEVGAEKAKGEWICLPSDDSYYCPDFLTFMLAAGESADFVYCDVLYDRRMSGVRSVLSQEPKCCQIDKTGFIVRRDCWIEIPKKNTETLGPSLSDGWLAEEFVRLGYKHKKLPITLIVHN